MISIPRPRYSTRFHRRFWPEIICSGPKPSVYITFDDGPHPVATVQALDVLRDEDVRATFFFSGISVDQFPDIVKRAHSEGHTIGNHGYSHRPMVFRSEKALSEELDRTNEAIHRATGTMPKLFRPPFGLHGRTLSRLLRQREMEMVLWSFDTQDFLYGKLNSFVQNVIEHTSPGSILLLHTNKLTVDHLPKYIALLLRELKRLSISTSRLSD